MALTKEKILELSRRNNEPEWMQNKRIEAFSLFERMDMPELRYGLHITSTYGDLNLEKLDFSNQHKTEVIDADMFAKHGIVIEDLHTALKTRQELVKKYFMTDCIKVEENKFTALHAAFWHRGLFIHIPKDIEVKTPIHLKLKAQEDVIDHILIISDSSSNIDIIEEVYSDKDNNKFLFRSGLVEIYAKENSKVQFASIQNYGNNVFNFTIKRALVERDANVNWLDCVFGSKITISNVSSLLKGNGARSNNWAVFYGDEKQHYDFSMNSVHEAPDTVSDMLTKGVLSDHAKSIYRGTIKIAKQAPRSNGYQKEDTLLLSDKAEIDSIPKLEIDTNDVKCSHGAAIGQIDEDKLFYMMSRGISEDLAKKKIVEGFFHPMLKKIAIEELRNNLMNMIDKRMG